MIKDLLVAERYAQALFEISRALGKDEEVEAQLENFSAALKSDPGLERLFGNPYLSLGQKRGFLAKLFAGPDQVSKLLLDFYTVLFEKGRFALVHEIAAVFKRIADEAQGQATIQIRSASPLSAAQEAAIVGRLESMAGYKIAVEKMVDPSLIGGVVVRLKNRVLDGSVRHRIDEMKKELLKIHEN